MRWLLIVLLLFPTASAQFLPEVSMTWNYLDQQFPEATQEGVIDVPIEVMVECTTPTGTDFMDHFTVIFVAEGTHATAQLPEDEELPPGLCAFGFFGSWSQKFNITVFLDQSKGSPEGDVLAYLNTTVGLMSSHAQLAPAPPDVTRGAAWFLLGDDETAISNGDEPPVPQAQTTPGPAVPLLAGLLLVAALRRRG